jgi:hypothetical protein
MWAIGALLLIAFALMLFGRITKRRGMSWVFPLLGIAAWIVVSPLAIHGLSNDDRFALGGLFLFSMFIANLIAIPILRRRVIPPCVRVKGASQSGNIAMIIVIALVIFLLVTGRFHPFGLMIFFGLLVVFMIITLIRSLFGKTEICGNGVWQSGSFGLWEEFESFSWQWKTKDSVVLNLVPKSWVWPTTRLVVPREDREAVQQLLEANLPDLNK